MDDDEPTVVFKGSITDIDTAVAVLEGEGIFARKRNDIVQSVEGAGVVGAGYNYLFGPAEVLVRASDAERARLILKDIEKSSE